MDAYNTETKKTKLVIVMSKYKERVYGDTGTGISKDEQMFSVGDLVVFNGKLFTPDYTYVDQTIESYATVGIVVSVYAHGNYIDSHIYLQYPSEEQPKNGDVICTITLYCQDTEKLGYLEAEVTKRILTALTITYPWERDGLN